MKNFTSLGLIITIIFLVSAFVGCSKSDTDIVRENAEQYLQRTLDDASSYEFVHLEYNGVITQRDNLNDRISSFNLRLEIAQESKKRQENSIYPLEGAIERAEKNIERYSSIVAELEALKLDIGSRLDEIACHTYEFDFRASNRMGGIELINSFLYVTPDLEVTHLATTTGQLLNTCNELEEYRDVIRNNPA